MLKYEYINRDWIVSGTARGVDRAAAALSLLLLVVLVVVALGSGMLGPLRPMLKPILLLAVLGMAITGLGMEYFLFRFDHSGPLKQVVGYCVMIFAPLGPALCCFFVYSRSDLVKSSIDRTREING
jgi:hypothetical protein